MFDLSIFLLFAYFFVSLCVRVPCWKPTKRTKIPFKKKKAIRLNLLLLVSQHVSRYVNPLQIYKLYLKLLGFVTKIEHIWQKTQCHKSHTHTYTHGNGHTPLSRLLFEFVFATDSTWFTLPANVELSKKSTQSSIVPSTAFSNCFLTTITSLIFSKIFFQTIRFGWFLFIFFQTNKILI